VFDRRYALLFRRVPPFVRNDAVSAGVASGEQGGVSGRGAGVGVVVVAFGEISASIEKYPETPVAELVAIAFQVIAAELINHDDDDELGTGIVNRCGCGGDRAKQEGHAQGLGESHRELVYRRTRRPHRDSSPRLSRRAQLALFSFVYCCAQERGGVSPIRTAESLP